MKKFILILLGFSHLTFAAEITVSGISSGAYMAQQFHTAFSQTVNGVGIVAGGPFYCAKGSIIDALNKCMKTSMGTPTSQNSLQEAKKLASTGHIDPLENLAHAKVWAISGTKDDTVVQKVADVLIQSYKDFGVNPENIIYKNNIAMGHAFPTENYGNACTTASQPPFISKCGFDGAGEILKHLIGPLAAKGIMAKDHLFQFEQLKFADGIALDKLSMHETGYAYIPEGCDQPERNGCHIHIAFHGCKQTLDDFQTTFIMHAGYNEWAESNRIVILYPQAKKNTLGNPNGCWDWWGYTGGNYHTKEGPQMKLVMKMLSSLKLGNIELRKSK